MNEPSQGFEFTCVVAPLGELFLVFDKKILCVVINWIFVGVESFNQADVDETEKKGFSVSSLAS